jgi:uncharacterized protein (TIGR00730 family)
MTFSVCIYCASSSDIDDLYKNNALDAARFCALQGWRVVYGGGNVGLMGLVADAAVDAGGAVIGVIPEFLQRREVAHLRLTELHITHTMHERQMKMADLSDAFIVLPGGLGTLAEFFEIVTWRQLGLHDKPIFILNTNHYWDHTILQMEMAHQQGFIRQNLADLFRVVDNIADIIPYLD